MLAWESSAFRIPTIRHFVFYDDFCEYLHTLDFPVMDSRYFEIPFRPLFFTLFTSGN